MAVPLPNVDIAGKAESALSQTFSFGGNTINIPAKSSGGFTMPVWGWAGIGVLLLGLGWFAFKRRG